MPATLKKNFYYALLIGCLFLLLVSALSEYYNLFVLFPPDGNFLSNLWLTTNITSQLISFMVIFHFAADKKIILSILITAGLLINVWINSIMADYNITYVIEVSNLIFLDRISFWIYIALAASYIYYDQKRYSWLMYIGIINALFEIVRYMNVNENSVLSVCQYTLQISGDIAFILYIWDFMKRADLLEQKK
ncbi:MAG: hypothetical protein IPM77_12745 [Crocinitomicaceae bacterium]|nr:hypothetical protein [Crocinitomicaceae bacterium]